MNYLLLFENFYQPITSEYFGERVFGNREKFTKDELEKIAKIVPKYHLHSQGDRIDILLVQKTQDKYFDIVKLKDEWYYIIYSVTATFSLPARGLGPEREFYKCDQFDGLISFLQKNL